MSLKYQLWNSGSHFILALLHPALCVAQANIVDDLDNGGQAATVVSWARACKSHSRHRLPQLVCLRERHGIVEDVAPPFTPQVWLLARSSNRWGIQEGCCTPNAGWHLPVPGGARMNHEAGAPWSWCIIF